MYKKPLTLNEMACWKESESQSKESIINEAHKNHETIHLASLMTIVSIKGSEKDPGEWRVKARIVFRGDAARDQGGLNAIFQNLAPSSIAGLNTVMAFSMLQGNSCSTSDCVRAYIQSHLKTKHRTFVKLPPGIVPASKCHIKAPCARPYKSLFGHPESSAYWQAHFVRCSPKAVGRI